MFNFVGPSALTMNITKNTEISSIVVQWDEVDDSLTTVYIVTWTSERDHIKSSLGLVGVTSYTITGLTLDTVYTITVTAANICGQGPEYSTSVSLTTSTASTISTISSTTATATTNPMTSTATPSSNAITTAITSSSTTATTVMNPATTKTDSLTNIVGRTTNVITNLHSTITTTTVTKDSSTITTTTAITCKYISIYNINIATGILLHSYS